MTTRKKMVKALDDWLPSFSQDLVQASFHKDNDGHYRVAVWGQDDHGMEKVFKSKVEAKKTYDELNIISHDYLKTMGFVVA